MENYIKLYFQDITHFFATFYLCIVMLTIENLLKFARILMMIYF